MKINKYITSFGLLLALLSCNKDNEPKPDNIITIADDKSTADNKSDITINVDEYMAVNAVEFKLKLTGISIELATEVIKPLTKGVKKAEFYVSINQKLREEGTKHYNELISLAATRKHDYSIPLGKETKYYVSAVITDINGKQHYGKEVAYTVSPTINKEQRKVKVENTSLVANNTSLVLIAESIFIGEKPSKFIVEYSKKSDFSVSVNKDLNSEIKDGKSGLLLQIDKLDPASKYYLRYVATFADGKTYTSEVSTFETIDKYTIGKTYGIDGNTYAQFLVFSSNTANQTGKVVQITNATSTIDWKKGNVDVDIKGKTYSLSRPTVQDLEELKNVEDNNSAYWLGLSTTVFSEKLKDQFYATSEEDPSDASKTIEYNPFTKKSRSVAKKLTGGTRNERYILEVK
ncbi:hypothetical protein EI427_17925 [Flammeovirga pectinis]|uniref:Uncharacterized protein n=1 Tax=Flammeovirga pectinis TaxID=2494373 RepID=A0A3S9P756_9BACT|nr:hypothetical protein [Flammeovirga pectinis]AZQ64036.1 hypothetical protein EI427_17925 [Flammeovirga pectinis]